MNKIKNSGEEKKTIEQPQNTTVSIYDIPEHVRMYDTMKPIAKAVAGNTILRQALKYDEGRKAVYMEGSYYYTIIGSVLNMVQSVMVDCHSMMKDMGIFRHELKYQSKLAKDEVDALLKHIKYCIREVNVMGTEQQKQQAYQFWLDATDYVCQQLQPKLDRIETVMAAYVKKSGAEKYQYVAKLCLVSTLILFVRDNLYPDIIKATEHLTGFNYNSIFPHGDGSKVYAAWEKVERSQVWPVFTLDFKDSKAVTRAFDSFAKMFREDKLYRRSTAYAQQFLPDDVKEAQKKLDKQLCARNRRLRKEHEADEKVAVPNMA